MDEFVTKFILVRHGETVANSKLIFQGWMESPLNQNGIAQANAAAEYLKNQRIDAAYSSISSRAADTARAVMEYHPGVELVLTEELREWHLGELEGRYQPDILKETPEAIRAFKSEDLEPAIKGGETRMQFQHRISSFFARITLLHPGQNVLICTHGGVMQRIFRMAAGVTAAGNMLPLPVNASVSSVLYFHRTGQWQLDTWNYHDHLQGLRISQTLAH